MLAIVTVVVPAYARLHSLPVLHPDLPLGASWRLLCPASALESGRQVPGRFRGWPGSQIHLVYVNKLFYRVAKFFFGINFQLINGFYATPPPQKKKNTYLYHFSHMGQGCIFYMGSPAQGGGGENKK